MNLSGGLASADLEGRLRAILRELEAIAAEIPLRVSPDFFGGLERVRWVARIRLSSPEAKITRADTAQPLMTVEQVAAHLGGISKAQVYRLAKTHLRPAVVQIGEGTLRFDPDRIDRFIEARRRV